jgi:hypothetical protein
MKGTPNFVGIKVSIDQEKTIDNLIFFWGQLEVHLGNLNFVFGPILCLYIVFDIS